MTMFFKKIEMSRTLYEVYPFTFPEKDKYKRESFLSNVKFLQST